VVHQNVVPAPQLARPEHLGLGPIQCHPVHSTPGAYGIENLVAAVEAAYDAMNADTLDNIFLTLQSCMLCILREDGGNQYKLPHLGKDKLRKSGVLPRVLEADHDLYDKVKAMLEAADRPSLVFFE
jgi:hypothetical protein